MPKLRLGINIDHIATIRNARKRHPLAHPDLIRAADAAIKGGADSITFHLREDRRHIQDRDIYLLKEMLQTRLNLEMAVTGEMLDIAERVRPHACCLVPERRAELTTEGGLDVLGGFERVKAACTRLSEAGVEVSLFIDPDPRQIDAAVAAGAPVVELHTGRYAEADRAEQFLEMERIRAAAAHAKQAGLQVNAGHGLHLHNVEEICRIPQITELNIGHSIITQALFSGLDLAVRDMKRVMRAARAEI